MRSRRALRAWLCASLRVALLPAALAVAGCTTGGSPTVSLVGASAPTVAFESIDGPPVGIFNKLVDTLASEAQARQVAVVTREGAAQYRIRGYAAIEVRRNQTTINWVWDVYDAEQHRALRISGEEPATNGERGWNAVDDPALRRMAHSGMDQLAAFLANPAAVQATPLPAPSPAPASEPASTVAAQDQPQPASSGLAGFFRNLGPSSASAATATAGETPSLPDPAPLPRRRPRNLGLAAHAAATD